MWGRVPGMFRLTFSHLLLLLVAAIWGSGFVAQKLGLEHIGPYSFNAARLALATLALLLVWRCIRRRGLAPQTRLPLLLGGGALAGAFLFAGLTFQQVGLQYTTATNAGFITSLYLVIVPLLGLLAGQRTRWQTWSGIVLAVAGLYYLSMKQGAGLNRGDLLQFIGAFFWAGHVVALGWLSRHIRDFAGLSVLQFAMAALLAILAARVLEQEPVSALVQAAPAILYSGLVVIALGFTLQVLAQQVVSASVAALMLSFEAAFAALMGWLFLGESIGPRELAGCSLMLAGLLVSQLPGTAKTG